MLHRASSSRKQECDHSPGCLDDVKIGYATRSAARFEGATKGGYDRSGQSHAPMDKRTLCVIPLAVRGDESSREGTRAPFSLPAPTKEAHPTTRTRMRTHGADFFRGDPGETLRKSLK